MRSGHSFGSYEQQNVNKLCIYKRSCVTERGMHVVKLSDIQKSDVVDVVRCSSPESLHFLSCIQHIQFKCDHKDIFFSLLVNKETLDHTSKSVKKLHRAWK